MYSLKNKTNKSHVRFILKEIMNGKSFARALFNAELFSLTIRGAVLDVGGGKHQDYLDFLQKEKGVIIQTVDMVVSGKDSHQVDFEKDTLPFESKSIDQVLVFNVLEHIYNYNFLVGEMYRVLKDNAELIGFVPFLVNYHPDPHDYFRYTKEALLEIFKRNGFKNISVKEIGRGPFAVNYNNIMLSLPMSFRVVLFPWYYLLDSLFLSLRPKIKERYPLGYLFIAKK